MLNIKAHEMYLFVSAWAMKEQPCSHGRWYQLSDEKLVLFISAWLGSMFLDLCGFKAAELWGFRPETRCFNLWCWYKEMPLSFSSPSWSCIPEEWYPAGCGLYGINETYSRAVCSDANSRHESSSALDSHKSCLSYNTADSGFTVAERTLSRSHNHTADSHHTRSNVVWCGTNYIHDLCITIHLWKDDWRTQFYCTVV